MHALHATKDKTLKADAFKGSSVKGESVGAWKT
jgi:hypothetical protein